LGPFSGLRGHLYKGGRALSFRGRDRPPGSRSEIVSARGASAPTNALKITILGILRVEDPAPVRRHFADEGAFATLYQQKDFFP